MPEARYAKVLSDILRDSTAMQIASRAEMNVSSYTPGAFTRASVQALIEYYEIGSPLETRIPIEEDQFLLEYSDTQVDQSQNKPRRGKYTILYKVFTPLNTMLAALLIALTSCSIVLYNLAIKQRDSIITYQIACKPDGRNPVKITPIYEGKQKEAKLIKDAVIPSQKPIAFDPVVIHNKNDRSKYKCGYLSQRSIGLAMRKRCAAAFRYYMRAKKTKACSTKKVIKYLRRCRRNKYASGNDRL